MKIGVIGGSGLDDSQILKSASELEVETPYGSPSSSITSGTVYNVEVCIIARHGKNHHITPKNVNNRANIYALKQIGCTHIIATTAVGSLREEIGRGHFVILSDFIDFTRHREISFHDSFAEGIKHASLAEPFSEFLRQIAVESCVKLLLPFHRSGTVITIEGPRFSTRAESELFRMWGADVINMSIAPEAILAREAGLEYLAIAMSTDYDCWKQEEKPVSWEDVLATFNDNAHNMKELILDIIQKLSSQALFEKDKSLIKSKIRTIPHWPKPGIMFRDITTLLKDKEGLHTTLKVLEERYKGQEFDIIAGIESRGFVVASALASRLGKGVVLIRKPGKLPAETIKEEYALEYGTDAVEIHKDAIKPGDRVLLADDLLATGGTASAACNLIENLGGKVIECAFIIELPDLKGRARLNRPVFSIVEFEGD